MQLRRVLVLAIAFACLTGCSNALYFYETDKISMSLEGRPDSSQPVQGSLGLKQRVVVVAPPKDPDTMTKARSEPVSMISTFRFRKDKGGFADLGPVTIQTALVTGSAATALNKHETQRVARAQVSFTRTPEFVTPDRQKRVDQILHMISALNDAAVLSLDNDPPVSDPEIEKVIKLRDPQNRRFADPKVAREILKMRATMSKRSNEDLDAWEAALRAAPSNQH